MMRRVAASIVGAIVHSPPALAASDVKVHVISPFVGCENGRTIMNWDAPIHGGPKPICDRGIPIALPEEEAHPRKSGTAQIGTIVVMSISQQQVMLAADSRASLLDSADKYVGVDDSICKIAELQPTLLFAVDGKANNGSGFPSTAYYDAFKVARHVVTNFRFDPQRMEQNKTIREIAEDWAWEVAFTIQRGVNGGTYRVDDGTIVEGIFAGLEPDGSVSTAVATLEHHQPRPGRIAPPVSVSISYVDPPQKFTWIQAFGQTKVVDAYLDKNVTDETRAENAKLHAELWRNPRHFSPETIKRLVQLTEDKDDARWDDGSKLVGGDVDIAKISKNGKVHWLHRKPACSLKSSQQ